MVHWLDGVDQTEGLCPPALLGLYCPSEPFR